MANVGGGGGPVVGLAPLQSFFESVRNMPLAPGPPYERFAHLQVLVARTVQVYRAESIRIEGLRAQIVAEEDAFRARKQDIDATYERWRGRFTEAERDDIQHLFGGRRALLEVPVVPALVDVASVRGLCLTDQVACRTREFMALYSCLQQMYALRRNVPVYANRLAAALALEEQCLNRIHAAIESALRRLEDDRDQKIRMWEQEETLTDAARIQIESIRNSEVMDLECCELLEALEASVDERRGARRREERAAAADNDAKLASLVAEADWLSRAKEEERQFRAALVELCLRHLVERRLRMRAELGNDETIEMGFVEKLEGNRGRNLSTVELLREYDVLPTELLERKQKEMEQLDQLKSDTAVSEDMAPPGSYAPQCDILVGELKALLLQRRKKARQLVCIKSELCIEATFRHLLGIEVGLLRIELENKMKQTWAARNECLAQCNAEMQNDDDAKTILGWHVVTKRAAKVVGAKDAVDAECSRTPPNLVDVEARVRFVHGNMKVLEGNLKCVQGALAEEKRDAADMIQKLDLRSSELLGIITALHGEIAQKRAKLAARRAELDKCIAEDETLEKELSDWEERTGLASACRDISISLALLVDQLNFPQRDADQLPAKTVSGNDVCATARYLLSLEQSLERTHQTIGAMEKELDALVGIAVQEAELRRNLAKRLSQFCNVLQNSVADNAVRNASCDEERRLFSKRNEILQSELSCVHAVTGTPPTFKAQKDAFVLAGVGHDGRASLSCQGAPEPEEDLFLRVRRFMNNWQELENQQCWIARETERLTTEQSTLVAALHEGRRALRRLILNLERAIRATSDKVEERMRLLNGSKAETDQLAKLLCGRLSALDTCVIGLDHKAMDEMQRLVATGVSACVEPRAEESTDAMLEKHSQLLLVRTLIDEANVRLVKVSEEHVSARLCLVKEATEKLRQLRQTRCADQQSQLCEKMRQNDDLEKEIIVLTGGGELARCKKVRFELRARRPSLQDKTAGSKLKRLLSPQQNQACNDLGPVSELVKALDADDLWFLEVAANEETLFRLLQREQRDCSVPEKPRSRSSDALLRPAQAASPPKASAPVSQVGQRPKSVTESWQTAAKAIGGMVVGAFQEVDRSVAALSEILDEKTRTVL